MVRRRGRGARPAVSDSAQQGNFVQSLGECWFSETAEEALAASEQCTNAAGCSETSGPQELMRGLPDDLVRQWILPKVSPASYGKMKQVSKGWESLVRSGEWMFLNFLHNVLAFRLGSLEWHARECPCNLMRRMYHHVQDNVKDLGSDLLMNVLPQKKIVL